jgi:hypothetical protein
MAKDPAALLYIDTWKVATTEMRAVERAYYMDLILHQFDKGDLPNDIEELANICRVRFSEFEQFKQVFEQVLKHKFEQNESGRLENEFAKDIIRKRKDFVNKRSDSGKLSYIIRYARKYFKASNKKIEFLKEHLDVSEIDTKNEQVLKQVLEQIFELYIDGDGDGNKNKSKEVIFPFVSENFKKWWDLWREYKKGEHDFKYKSHISEQAALKELSGLSKGNESIAIKIIEQSISKGWKGFFELKKNNTSITQQSYESVKQLLEQETEG